jgi:hypothetical protein
MAYTEHVPDARRIAVLNGQAFYFRKTGEISVQQPGLDISYPFLYPDLPPMPEISSSATRQGIGGKVVRVHETDEIMLEAKRRNRFGVYIHRFVLEENKWRKIMPKRYKQEYADKTTSMLNSVPWEEYVKDWETFDTVEKLFFCEICKLDSSIIRRLTKKQAIRYCESMVRYFNKEYLYEQITIEKNSWEQVAGVKIVIDKQTKSDIIFLVKNFGARIFFAILNGNSYEGNHYKEFFKDSLREKLIEIAKEEQEHIKHNKAFLKFLVGAR